MKKLLLLALVLLLPLSLRAAEPAPTIQDGSTTVVALSDGTTVRMKFRVTPDGTAYWIGALARDVFFDPPVNGGTGPSPSPTPTPTPSGPIILTTSLPGAIQGTAYAGQLVAAGGTLPYVWVIASGVLPAGMSLLPAGAVSGTPSVWGNFPFSIICSDAKGQTATQGLTLQVAAPPAPPTPVQKPLAAVVCIYEKDTIVGPEFAQTMRSKAVYDFCIANKIRYRCEDQDVKDETGKTPADLAVYIARAQKNKLPWVMMIDADGTMLWEGVPPTTDTDLLAKIKVYQKKGG